MAKIKDYLARYNNLKSKSENDKTEIKTLEKIIFAMQGLKKTKERCLESEEIRSGKKKMPYDSWRDYDPGKCDTAYFYAKIVTENEIVASEKFKPHAYEKCPDCNKRNPIIVKYEQTEDSPEGDTWEAEAFAICCDKIRTIKHIGGDSRFLHIE
ncbi:MAG: hypothetical protein V1886_02445 [archaeon]